MARPTLDGFDKAKAILAGAFPDREDRLDGGRPATETMDAIRSALEPEFGIERASEIAFHMADWNADAAFILAVHLFPERFTEEEIEDGVRLFLIHAPNHIAEAARLAGCPAEDVFREDT